MPIEAAAAQQVPAAAGGAPIHNEGQYANITGGVSKDEMINITSCEFPQFKQFMGDKYGAPQFDQGFAIVKASQDIIFEENGERQLMEQLSSIFPD